MTKHLSAPLGTEPDCFYLYDRLFVVSEIFRLTQIEHVSRRDEGHEVHPRGERHHADQDEPYVVDAATKQDDAEETGEEDRAACSVPITHLEEEKERRGDTKR